MTLKKQFPISVIYETKTEEEWLAVEKENGGIYIIPEGRPIIYKYPNGNGYYHRMKIGDGISTISQLPFTLEDGKVDKTNLSNRVYCTLSDGTASTLEYDSAVKKYTLVYRYTNGRVRVGTPVESNDATTKEYVDSTVASVPIKKGTGEGAAQQLTDDATFSIDSDYVDSKVQDKTGTKSVKTGAFGDYSTELGGKSQAKGKRSVAEGTSTIALGNYSHSEGNKTFAEGGASHAEGLQSEARGNDSHAEGYLSISTGSHSHAEGYLTHAKGHASHTEGNGTISNGQAQHVQGAWNIEDETPHTPEGYSKYAHIVGNGTSENDRSNAHTLDWDGNAWYAGSVEASSIILNSGGKRYKLTINNGQLVINEI
jgi:hypothetical protein